MKRDFLDRNLENKKETRTRRTPIMATMVGALRLMVAGSFSLARGGLHSSPFCDSGQQITLSLLLPGPHVPFFRQFTHISLVG